MTMISHTASSGEFAVVIENAAGDVFDRRAGRFIDPAAGLLQDLSLPLSGPVDGVYTGEVYNLPPGTYTYRLYSQPMHVLSRGQIDGTITELASGTITQNPPIREANSTAAVSVEAAGSPAYNGASLLAAYAQAKTLTPNGSALSATNRASVIVEPGMYDFDGQSLTLDTEFVDLVGLDEKNTVLHTTNASTIVQSADDVAIRDLTAKCTNTAAAANNRTDPAAYDPARNLPNAKVKNVTLEGITNGHATTHDTVNTDSFVGTYEFVTVKAGDAFQQFGGTGRFINSPVSWGLGLASTARLYHCGGPTGSFASKDAAAKTLFCYVNDAAYANND